MINKTETFMEIVIPYVKIVVVGVVGWGSGWYNALLKININRVQLNKFLWFDSGQEAIEISGQFVGLIVSVLAAIYFLQKIIGKRK